MHIDIVEIGDYEFEASEHHEAIINHFKWLFNDRFYKCYHPKNSLFITFEYIVDDQKFKLQSLEPLRFQYMYDRVLMLFKRDFKDYIISS